MKNITFDESSVLAEFAKIAHKNGLIKVAENPAGVGESQTTTIAPLAPGGPKPGAAGGAAKFNAALKSYPALLAINSNTPANLQVTYDSMKKFFPTAKQQLGQLADYPQLARPLLKKLTDFFAPRLSEKQMGDVSKEMAQYYDEPAKKSRPVIDPADMMSEDGLDSEAATNSNTTVKNAKDDASKLYDVSGETGEDVINEAHPGGGTRTELTHSKTDENLVETEIEQQKRDVGVAKSVPKGTYAALAALAGKLDKLGLYNEANEIDSIISDLKKKVKVAQVGPQDFRWAIYNDLSKLKGAGHAEETRYKPQMLKEWESASFRTTSQGMQALKKLVSRWGQAIPGMNAVYTSPSVDITEPVAVGKDLPITLQPRTFDKPKADSIAGDSPATEEHKRKRYKRGEGIRVFQKWFNKLVETHEDYSSYHVGKADGIYGPKTKAADMLVRKLGGRVKFEQKMKAEGIGLAQIPPPAAPAAPPPPTYQAYDVEQEVIAELEVMYPQLKGKLHSDEWHKVRMQIRELTDTGRYTADQIAAKFDVPTMKFLRKTRDLSERMKSRKPRMGR